MWINIDRHVHIEPEVRKRDKVKISGSKNATSSGRVFLAIEDMPKSFS
jgi:hypothetical protein